MLVHVNFLPQKEKKSKSFPIIMATLVGLFVVVSVILLVQYAALTANIAAKEKQVEDSVELRIQKEARLAQMQESEEIRILKETVELVNNLPISNVNLLETIFALLPSDGYLLNYRYAEGEVQLIIQFRSLPQSAAYLHYLTESEWFENVELVQVSTQIMQNEDEDDDNLEKIEERKNQSRYQARYRFNLNYEAIRTEQKGGTN